MSTSWHPAVSDREKHATVLKSTLNPGPLAILDACQSSRMANEETAARTDYLLEPAEGLDWALLYGGSRASARSGRSSIDPRRTLPSNSIAKRSKDTCSAKRSTWRGSRRGKKNPEQVMWAAFAPCADTTFRLAH